MEFNKISPGSASTTGRSSSSFQNRSRLTRRKREDKETLGSVMWILTRRTREDKEKCMVDFRTGEDMLGGSDSADRDHPWTTFDTSG